MLENDGGISTYQTIDGETIEYTNDKLAPSSLERVSDVSLKVPGISNLTELDEFGEGAVVYQLRERYKQDCEWHTCSPALWREPLRLLACC